MPEYYTSEPFEVALNQEVFLLPTYNAARHWNGRPISGRVVKVGRLYFYVETGWRRQLRFRLDDFTFADEDGFNERYYAYPTYQAADAELLYYKQEKEVRAALNTHQHTKRIPYDTMAGIHQLLIDCGVIA